MSDKGWLSKAWDWLGHLGNIQTAGQLFAAFGVSNVVTAMLPSGWHPPQYWAVFGTVLFGTMFIVGVIVHGVRAGYEFLAPRSIVITPLRGRGKATLQFAHAGALTTYKVQGRIIELVAAGGNPAPGSFHAELQPGAGQKGDFDVTLAGGAFAHVIVADIGSSEDVLGGGTTWLQVRRGKYGSVVQIPDSGAVIEYSVVSLPGRADGVGTRRYRVVRDTADHAFVNIEEITDGATIQGIPSLPRSHGSSSESSQSRS